MWKCGNHINRELATDLKLDNMKKGKIILIGGHEDKGLPEDEKKCIEQDEFLQDSILKRIVDESAKKKQSRIEIIPTASMEPEDTAQDYLHAFGLLKVKDVGVLDIRSREDATELKNIERIRKADVVFFTGGDQVRLTSVFGGTPIYDLIHEKLEKENFIYAGTSAGAAAASDSMIYEGRAEHSLLKGEVKTATGFGIVTNIIFDTHFINRGRIGRLFQLIVSNPTILGVGLEENTGLLFHKNKMEAIGTGMTIIVDGRSIRQSNLLEIREEAPLSIDSLTLHVMSRTDVFDLETRQLEINTEKKDLK